MIKYRRIGNLIKQLSNWQLKSYNHEHAVESWNVRITVYYTVLPLQRKLIYVFYTISFFSVLKRLCVENYQWINMYTTVVFLYLWSLFMLFCPAPILNSTVPVNQKAACRFEMSSKKRRHNSTYFRVYFLIFHGRIFR